jgi:hypothetical protein
MNVKDRPERGRICRPHFHVPVLGWLRDEDHALRPVQLATGRSAVVVPKSFEAVSSDRHFGLAFQWQAEELHGIVFHSLYHFFVNSMVCQLLHHIHKKAS